MSIQNDDESLKFPREKARDLLRRGNELLDRARELGLTQDKERQAASRAANGVNQRKNISGVNNV